MTTKTFQSKPKTITAIQWTDTQSYWDICTFLGIGLTYIGKDKLLEIPLADDTYVHAQQNDWIVKDANGNIKVIPDTDITANYDDVTASTTTTTTSTTTTTTP